MATPDYLRLATRDALRNSLVDFLQKMEKDSITPRDALADLAVNEVGMHQWLIDQTETLATIATTLAARS